MTMSNEKSPEKIAVEKLEQLRQYALKSSEKRLTALHGLFPELLSVNPSASNEKISSDSTIKMKF